MHKIIHGDCSRILEARLALDNPFFDCIFADPPDNIGMKYNGYEDKIPDKEYINLLRDWINLFLGCSSTVWISFSAKWTAEVGEIICELKESYPYSLEAKPFMQVFTFGQNRTTDCGNGHRPLWRFRWDKAKLYPEQIKVQSWRQIHGDKRAAPGGRVPLDVWDFPRVTGNSRQRRKWIGNQLNEGLIERAIKLSTKEGDTVCDPFAGSGTTLRVCKRINRSCTLIEISERYCEEIAKEHNLEVITELTEQSYKGRECKLKHK